MKPFSRVLVSLDLTEMDFTLLKFICRFISINPFIEYLYFIYVEKDLEIPPSGKEIKYMGHLPNDERIKIKMRNEVERFFRNNGNIKVHYEIAEGDPLKQLLHWSNIKLINLIVAGKKSQKKGSGIIMEKLARKSDCSILFVPENFKARFKKILIPVDFSKRTDNVFETACMIQKYLPHTQFYCLHVVEVPGGYTRIGKTYDEFAWTMVEHAEQRWEKYYKEHNLAILEPVHVCKPNENGSIAKSIINYAHDQNIDLIMMGSKKQTKASAFILGSVGEELVSRDKDILLLLVKDRQAKKTYNFFKAMKKV